MSSEEGSLCPFQYFMAQHSPPRTPTYLAMSPDSSPNKEHVSKEEAIEVTKKIELTTIVKPDGTKTVTHSYTITTTTPAKTKPPVKSDVPATCNNNVKLVKTNKPTTKQGFNSRLYFETGSRPAIRLGPIQSMPWSSASILPKQKSSSKRSLDEPDNSKRARIV